MPLDVALSTFSLKRLEPVIDPFDSDTMIVNLGPGQTLALGTVLGQVTGSANDVQTLTVTGTPTGGSVTVTFTNPITRQTYTVVIPFNASAASAQTLVNAATGSGVLTVGGGALPGSALTFTAAGTWQNMPIPIGSVTTNALTGGSSPAGAVTHTTTGRSANTFVAYASGNSDGSQVAKALLPWDVVTDANGLVTFGLQSGGGEWAEVHRTLPVYIKGYFATQDLVGLDATAASALGKLVGGSLTTGTLRVS